MKNYEDILKSEGFIPLITIGIRANEGEYITAVAFNPNLLEFVKLAPEVFDSMLERTKEQIKDLLKPPDDRAHFSPGRYYTLDE